MFGKFSNRILVPLTLHIVILCSLCVILSLPPVWNTGYRFAMESKLMPYEKKELIMEDALLISGGLWSQESYTEISGKLKAYVLNEKEQRHFEDVRKLLRRAIYVVMASVSLLLLFRKSIAWKVAWIYALIFYAIEGIIFWIWSAVAWRHMFRTLHWWIFQNDSWILPKGSYSLFLYPHSVWQMAGTSIFVAFFIILLIGFILTPKSSATRH